MKFLIVRLSSLGDIVHTLPIVNALRQNSPDSQIDWLVGKSGFEFLSLVKEINNVYELNYKNILLIQKEKYDYTIDVQGLFKSAFLSKLSFGRKTIGFKNTREFADVFYDEKVNVGNLFKTKKHIVDINLELISSSVKNNDSKVKFLIPEIFESANTHIPKPTSQSVVVFPGTTWESKLWPMNYWFELIKNISRDFQIFVCGSTDDLDFINPLITKLDSENIRYINLTGKTNIKNLIYLIQNARLVIGMDSFGLHLSSAIKNDTGKPDVIGIYGPTSPIRNGPYNLINNCLHLSELECIACRKKHCPLGHHACMNNIIPSYVGDMIYSKMTDRDVS